MWQSQAACSGLPFFIERGGVEAKKAICHTCPVINECLAFAIVNNDFESTVYGGFTGDERHQLVVNGYTA